jgi:uridine monophosphate synthetase
VKDIAVLIDREQGGKQLLESKGYRLHSVLTLTEIIASLTYQRKINEAQTTLLYEFIGKQS